MGVTEARADPGREAERVVSPGMSQTQDSVDLGERLLGGIEVR